MNCPSLKPRRMTVWKQEVKVVQTRRKRQNQVRQLRKNAGRNVLPKIRNKYQKLPDLARPLIPNWYLRLRIVRMVENIVKF
jgi:hypothetical protein